jgi:hypothetical protein
MSSTTARSARRIQVIAGDRVVGAVGADGDAELLEGEPGDIFPGFDGGLAESFEEEVMPVPDGPQTTRFSCRPTPFQRPAAWALGRDGGCVLVPTRRRSCR